MVRSALASASAATATATAGESPASPFLSPGTVAESEAGKEMIRQRANPKPLHNFTLPRLGWGSQIQMRCVKVSDRSVPHSESSSSLSAVRRRSSPRLSFDRASFGMKEDGDCDGVVGVREELLLDLRMKQGFKNDVEGDSVVAVGRPDGRREGEEEVGAEMRPWNLRTRRAACKAPAGKNCSPLRKEGLAVEEEMVSLEKVKEREKFSVALKRKEIENDFWKLTGHRPPRRPKKRLRPVQKQLDMLFPGLWLTEVTADAYKVVEVPDNVKR
ncbi:hypothetical protein MLD38_011418 [Melastoma candidum]|uniref:Uncharacterized protein n=1 Tax=Melastoma candidum TaxID=119954 RepID=A0ACB9R4C0_9MYRT|nr:hypothetical protein MLD38_011418 [Melastoma candidum]